MPRKLLMISTDRKIFERGSAVRARQAAYADGYDEVHILVFAGREFGEQAISGNCWAYPTRSAFKFAYPFDAARLGRFIVKRRGITDITCQDASLTAMAGLSLKRRFGLPLEIQVHEDIGAGHYAFSAANKIRKALALSHLPKADKIRVVSDKIKDYLVGALGIDASKIAVRPIEIDVGAIKGASITSDGDLRRKYPQFSKIVLMVSRFEKEKNLKLAVEAWPLALEKLPGAGLVIVGAGSLESRLKAMAARIFSSNGGIEPVAYHPVVFESWADKPALYSYYKTADLFLNTSLFEGYGMAMAEARAAGLPIVSTDVGVARELGATIVGWAPESVADGVVEALERPDDSRAAAERADQPRPSVIIS